MKSFRRLAYALLAFALVMVVVFVARAPRAEATTAVAADQLAILTSASLAEAPPPPPEQDTCQHCHLSGEITALFYPFGRWMVFAVFGAVFAYGGWRLASNWTTRAPWKPLMLRAVDWTEERFHLKEPLGKVLSKPVPMFATAWYYCLGGISFALFAILGITGIMLAFYYQPTPEGAYASIQYIETQVLFGSAVRAIHHWSANGMVVVVVAHMLRVFITGAFKAPRELNWMSGVFLLVLTLAFGLTGYLLPWDQTAFWASTVATEIAGAEPGIGNLALVLLRGGWEVTAVTLSRFFALHVLVLPAVIVLFLVAHFLMIRRQGIARPL
ncbi:MAG: cytochrome b N-terminal domain-containing protein [Anaerolineales bacterium]|nr:cytochrome b N-terminal domain-containing protein [Anaerolineales bacterium]